MSANAINVRNWQLDMPAFQGATSLALTITLILTSFRSSMS